MHSLHAGGGIYYSDILGSRRDYDGGLFTCARITVGIVEGGSRNQQWLLTGSVAQFLLSSAIRALFAFLLPFSFLPLRPTYSPSLVQYSQTSPTTIFSHYWSTFAWPVSQSVCVEAFYRTQRARNTNAVSPSNSLLRRLVEDGGSGDRPRERPLL